MTPEIVGPVPSPGGGVVFRDRRVRVPGLQGGVVGPVPSPGRGVVFRDRRVGVPGLQGDVVGPVPSPGGVWLSGIAG